MWKRLGRGVFVPGVGMLAALMLLVLGVAAVPAEASARPRLDHVFVVVMENHAYDEIIGNPAAPFINRLASTYGLATNYEAVSHPSLPNYLALIGGSTFGITDDAGPDVHMLGAPNIVDRIEGSGRTWKAYMESMPSNCVPANVGEYAVRHDPFVYFTDIRNDPARCQRVVPYTQLSDDLRSASTTPNFVWITPNVCNDMHDCSITTGDRWLADNLPTILNSAAFRRHRSLLVLTWDEDDGSQHNQVATLVIDKHEPDGFQSATPYTHYSLARTIEDLWHLAPLTANDATATPLSAFYTPPFSPHAHTNRAASAP